ncbi:catechol 2,3-dioxygenase-like lactoylglutathione lyase family enzyme [Natronobacillus azotifigens]|uniref:VOC family protein n=1 Tax=Natronobacillus azotifigens TaxID=472978 RepID=A0A9J6RF73_9BACI|nr:VOC family protein [Natronobacillus azotifigens]MCZ0703825.1 VOC family protein [Natronobacillus azotifigens]
MRSKISLVTILTDDVLKMKKFYQDVIGFNTEDDSEHNVEFESEGVRFSICSRQIMFDITGGHSSFKEDKKGQSFELAFPCDTPEEVEKSYKEMIEKGATPIKEPAQMPWGQTTAFFADPDGNIHEIFC